MECDSVHLLYRNCSAALVEGCARKEAGEEASAIEMDVDSGGDGQETASRNGRRQKGSSEGADPSLLLKLLSP